MARGSEIDFCDIPNVRLQDAANQAELESGAGGRGRSMRILRPAEANGVLVVEDEALVRMLVVQTLEEAGFSVRETAEAQGAMEVCAPADQARAHRADMKVLFMTGYADSGLIEKTLPRGLRPDHQALRPRRPDGPRPGPDRGLAPSHPTTRS